MEEWRYYLFWNYFIMIWIPATILVIVWVIIYQIYKIHLKQILKEPERIEQKIEQNLYKIKVFQRILKTYEGMYDYKNSHLKSSSSWYIYIYRCVENYKIWLALCRKSRLKQHLSSSPQEFDSVVLLKVPNMDFFERLLHNSFNDKRLHWEWFSLNELDMDVIKDFFWEFIVAK
jgi:hypothetical protein